MKRHRCVGIKHIHTHIRRGTNIHTHPNTHEKERAVRVSRREEKEEEPRETHKRGSRPNR
jgi:hypothetical protein